MKSLGTQKDVSAPIKRSSKMEINEKYIKLFGLPQGETLLSSLSCISKKIGIYYFIFIILFLFYFIIFYFLNLFLFLLFLLFIVF